MMMRMKISVIGAGRSFLLLFVGILFCCRSCHGFHRATGAPPTRQRHSISSGKKSSWVFNPSTLTKNIHRKQQTHILLLQNQATPDDENDSRIDVSLDRRLYRVRLSRAMGIDWGTDLSFAFVYVRSLDPSGAAALSGQVRVGDQLCEINGSNVIGASFDVAMEILAGLDYKSEKEVDLVFFRGTKDELKALCNSALAEPETITVTVIQNKGAPDQTTKILTAQPGVNVRELLVENGINVYQSVTRWTNCNGKQLCGTCIVNIPQGGQSTNRKSVDEASTLRENPETYRLSCITFAYGDVTVETFPPIQAAQWTR